MARIIPNLGGVVLVASGEYDETDSGTFTIVEPDGEELIILRTVIHSINGSGGGPRPRMRIGTPLDDDFYMAQNQSNLRQSNRVFQAEQYESTTDDVVVTLIPNGQTFDGIVYIWYMRKDNLGDK